MIINFFTDIAPNVIFSKDPTAVIDFYVQHKLLGDAQLGCN
jgi:hypothetical protein